MVFFEHSCVCPDELSQLTTVNKESWHYINCINLELHLKSNKINELENLITSLYLNLSFFNSFFVNQKTTVTSRWIDTLKKILVRSKLNPLYRSITCLILLECIKHSATFNQDGGQSLEEDSTLKFDIQLKILQLSDPQAALAIKAYYSQLNADEITYGSCLRQDFGPLISSKFSDLNYASILVKPFIGTKNEIQIQKKCLQELSADARILAKSNTIPFLRALLTLTIDNQSKTLLDQLQNHFDKLLLASQFNHQKDIAFILSLVLLNMPDNLIIEKLKNLKPAHLRDLHNIRSYSGQPMEETITLVLCNLLRNNDFNSNTNLGFLSFLPYTILRIENRITSAPLPLT